jgi:hypothetical protein
METAAHYRQAAAKMRALADTAANPALRSQYLALAAEYEKMAGRAEAWERKPEPPDQSEGAPKAQHDP